MGRPHCKGVAIGVARRGARRSGERTLRVPPSCSDPISHAWATPADRTSHVASFVRRSSAHGLGNVRACGRAWRAAQSALPKRFPVARGGSARKLVTGPLGRSGPHRSYAVESATTCSVHCPSEGGARFTGRTNPLSRGAGYISSASYARRGQVVTTDGELRRPTSSRRTYGDATTAPIPRVPKSAFRLAASRLIRTCRTPGERSAAAAGTCPALRPSA